MAALRASYSLALSGTTTSDLALAKLCLGSGFAWFIAPVTRTERLSAADSCTEPLGFSDAEGLAAAAALGLLSNTLLTASFACY